MPKGKYEKRVQHIVENTKMQREEVIVPKEIRGQQLEDKKRREIHTQRIEDNKNKRE